MRLQNGHGNNSVPTRDLINFVGSCEEIFEDEGPFKESVGINFVAFVVEGVRELIENVGVGKAT